MEILCEKEANQNLYDFLSGTTNANTNIDSKRSTDAMIIGTRATNSAMDSQKNNALFTLLSSQLSRKRKYDEIEENDEDF